MRNILILPLVIILLACNDSDDPELGVAIRTLDAFDQDSQAFVQGEIITIELTLSNLTSMEKTLSFSSGQQFDLILKNTSGNIIWTWSSDKTFTTDFTSIVLTAKGVHTETVDWNQVVDAKSGVLPVGNYTLEGFYLGVREVAAISLSIL